MESAVQYMLLKYLQNSPLVAKWRITVNAHSAYLCMCVSVNFCSDVRLVQCSNLGVGIQMVAI